MARLRVSARELRGQLVVLALVLWATALVNVWTPTLYLRSGQVKGTDFVQFYALARLAAEGRWEALGQDEAIRRAQLEAVPESEGDFYPALYGAQVGVLLAPLGRLSYLGALAMWLAMSTVVYLILTAALARRSPALRDHVPLVLLAAVAYPPFWLLVQHGHFAVLAMACLVGSWALLRRGRTLGAGVLLGLLAYKPPLVAPVLVMLALARSWRLLAGLLAGILLQFVPALIVGGSQSVVDYAGLLGRLPSQAVSLITRPEQLQGWRGFWWMLVPGEGLATGLYAASALVTLVLSAGVWRRVEDPSVRMAAVGLSIGLASPHTYAYDLVLLAPVWLWLTEWYLSRQGAPRVFGQALYVGYLAPLVGPLVAVTRLQVMTPVLFVLLLLLRRERA